MKVVCLALALGCTAQLANAADPSASAEPPGTASKSPHVVLIAGDEEYRSEEALSQLAKILREHHAMRCTLLLPIDPESGRVNPNVQHNIPGMEALDTADLLVLFTRFRNLPDEQMRYLTKYLVQGKPIVGIRTATHAFRFEPDSHWAHWSNGYEGENAAWQGGFGRLVLGEQWVAHHGKHKHESTRGVIAPGAEDHPITRGIQNGDIWGSTDVYAVNLPLVGDGQPLVLGQVMARAGEYDADDRFFGMRPNDSTPVAEKNDPMMPIAWTRTYKLPGGQSGKAMVSTIGSSTDLLSEGVRRLLVNGVYWCLDRAKEIPEEGTKVDLVGEYEPTQYSSLKDNVWEDRDLRPEDLE